MKDIKVIVNEYGSVLYNYIKFDFKSNEVISKQDLMISLTNIRKTVESMKEDGVED